VTCRTGELEAALKVEEVEAGREMNVVGGAVEVEGGGWGRREWAKE